MRLRRNAQAAGGVAVDHQARLQAPVLQITVHVAKLRDGLQLLLHDGRPAKKVLQVVSLQRVLELRIAHAPADLHVLHGLQEERRARNASQLRPQPVGDLVRANLAHVQGLQRDVEVGDIVSPPMKPVTMSTAGSVRTIAIYWFNLSRMVCKRHVFRRPGITIDSPGVLLRKKALGNHDVEIDGQADSALAGCQRPAADAATPTGGFWRTHPGATGRPRRWRDRASYA